MCKLVYFFKYQDGFDDGWYRAERLPAEGSLAGVQSIQSWHTLHAEHDPVPRRPLNNYDRLTEVRFSGLAAAEAALCSSDSPWRAPVRTGLDRFHAIVVDDEPEYDLRRDVPAQHYPYLALPVRWRMGKEPEVAEPRGTAMAKYMYCLGYRKDVDLRWAEDWYLGHHTREGKQLPGLMRYVTYRRRRLPRLDECRPEVADRWLCRPSTPTAGLSRRSG